MARDHSFFPKPTTANGLPWLFLSKPTFFAGHTIGLTAVIAWCTENGTWGVVRTVKMDA